MPVGDDQMVAEWLSNFREPTRSEYLKGLRRYMAWLSRIKHVKFTPTDLVKDHMACLYNTPPDDLESKRKHTTLLREYVEWLRGHGLSMYTIAHYVKAVRSFYDLSGASLMKFRVPSDPEAAARRVRLIPTVEEWLRLRPHLPGWADALMMTLLYTGMRVNEALELTPARLNPRRDQAVLRIYKHLHVVLIDMVNKKGRSLAEYFTFIGGNGWRRLCEYLRGAHPAADEPIFPYTTKTVQYVFLKAALASGLVKPPRRRGKGWRQQFHAHALRHLFSTEADQAGTSRNATEYFLGHEAGIRSIQAVYKHPRMYPESFAEEYAKLCRRLDAMIESSEATKGSTSR